jgi:hypothetical protein
MGLGDSIRSSIDEGLQASDFGVVVLSDAYFEGTSEWELNGIVGIHNNAGSFILPLWYGVGHAEVHEQSPSLADLKAKSLTEGNVSEVAGVIYRRVTSESESTDQLQEDASLFTDIEVRFQGSYTPEIGEEVTLKSWRNHNAPRFTQLEAVEILTEQGVPHTSRSKGTMMTVATIDGEPVNGVVSAITGVRSNKVEFTIRVKQSVIDELPDDPDYYKSALG